MKKLKKILIIGSFIVYILALLFILFGQRGFVWSNATLGEYIKEMCNFIPFKTIASQVQRLIFNHSKIAIINLSANLLMFIPMGVYLPYFIKKMNKSLLFSITIVISLILIETIQLFTRRGSFDIDDIILNFVGALIGYLFYKQIENKIITKNEVKVDSKEV